ncbi:MAG: nucleoid-associated protein [Bacteroidia bacterium]|nr:nucleoid-associated protein [Bacteroidia bacterium]
MFNCEQTNLESIVVHSVGNKSLDEKLRLSEAVLNIDEPLIKELLLKYFLSSFKDGSFYSFFDEKKIDNNIVFRCVSEIFDDPHHIFERSLDIAKHLYSQSNVQEINGGELFIVYLQDCVFGDEFTDAVGIFKSENKDTFLKIIPKNKNFNITADTGINIHKLDKGCLIANIDKETGFRVSIIDNCKNPETAGYWKDNFLKLKVRQDNYYYTGQYLNMCKDFIKNPENYPDEFERADQVDMLNKTVNYFKQNKLFNDNEFQTQVIQEPKIVDAFQAYKRKYETENDVPGMGEFDISQGAVKNYQKYFKSILKLDKNFHVYVHGDRKLLERGYDENKGMNYYKLFYNEEH